MHFAKLLQSAKSRSLRIAGGVSKLVRRKFELLLKAPCSKSFCHKELAMNSFHLDLFKSFVCFQKLVLPLAFLANFRLRDIDFAPSLLYT